MDLSVVPSDVIYRVASTQESFDLRDFMQSEKRFIEDWNATSLVCVGEYQGKICSCVREFITTTDKLSLMVNVWVAPWARGHKLGLRVMEFIIYQAKALEVWIDCRPSLGPYYSKMGYIQMHEVPEDVFCEHLPDQIYMVYHKASKNQEG